MHSFRPRGVAWAAACRPWPRHTGTNGLFRSPGRDPLHPPALPSRWPPCRPAVTRQTLTAALRALTLALLPASPTAHPQLFRCFAPFFLFSLVLLKASHTSCPSPWGAAEKRLPRSISISPTLPSFAYSTPPVHVPSHSIGHSTPARTGGSVTTFLQRSCSVLYPHLSPPPYLSPCCPPVAHVIAHGPKLARHVLAPSPFGALAWTY